jgi:hypothetical protein
VGSETADPLNEPINEEAMQIDDNWTMSEGTEELDGAQVDWCLGVERLPLPNRTTEQSASCTRA